VSVQAENRVIAHRPPPLNENIDEAKVDVDGEEEEDEADDAMNLTMVKRRKRGRPMNTSTVVDISQLLNMPLKAAASLLGFSESMLSRRFKEACNTRWPYKMSRHHGAADVPKRVCVRFRGPAQLQKAQLTLAQKLPGVEIFRVKDRELRDFRQKEEEEEE